MNKNSVKISDPRNTGKIVFSIGLGVLFLLNIAAVLHYSNVWKPVLDVKGRRFDQETGHCYLFHIDIKKPKSFFLASDIDGTSSLLVYENGRVLGPAHSPHKDIRNTGLGKYSHWGSDVYFSTSDNTDPRTNNRKYVFKYAVVIPPGFLLLILAADAAFIIRLSRRRLTDILFGPPALIIGGLMVAISWLIVRLPFFVNYRVPILSFDTPDYFYPIKQLFDGSLPLFAIRTPGYPLFLLVSKFFSSELMGIVVLQALFSLASALIMLIVVYRTYQHLTLFTAVILSVHVALPIMSSHDAILISESVYASSLLITSAVLILAVKRKNPLWFASFSFLACLTILIRPAGIFLVASLFIVLIFMFVNRYPWKTIASALLPMPLLLIGLFSYNLLTWGQFSMSAMGPISMYGITSSFWEPSPEFRMELNKGIVKFRDGISPADQKLMSESWDPKRLHWPFIEHAARAIYGFSEMSIPFWVFNETTHRITFQPNEAKAIYQHAIRQHPIMYIKWVWTTFYIFMMDPYKWQWQISIYNDIPGTYEQIYIYGESRHHLFAPWHVPDFPNTDYIRLTAEKKVELAPGLLQGMHREYVRMLSTAFQGKWWVSIYVLTLVASLGILIGSRLRNEDALLALVVCSSHFQAGLVIALAAGMVDRYSAPTQVYAYASLIIIVHVIYTFWKKMQDRPQ